MKQARSDANFIGVPPDMTDSINKLANASRGEREFIEDEESVDVDEEMEQQNNFLT
jgi:hypothetical protein